MIQYSLGELVDKLSIIHLKIWHLEERIADKDAPDEDVERMCDQVVGLNTARNEIVQGIDEMLESRQSGPLS